jgi:hypothetical protein
MTLRSFAAFLVTSVACLAVRDVRGETEFENLQCAGVMRALRAPLDSSDHRKYAPDRKVDILHLALDVTPDFKQRTIAGKATLTFKPIAKPLDELQLDARLMRYPLSYMIYSPAFDALPGDAKDAAYRRLRDVLSGRDRDPKFAHLTPAIRQTIVEILHETKADVVEGL